MGTLAAGADWQCAGDGLKSLWPRAGVVGTSAGKAVSARWDERTVAQTTRDAVVLEIWEDDGGAAMRLTGTGHGRCAADTRRVPVRRGSPLDVGPELPAPARPLRS